MRAEGISSVVDSMLPKMLTANAPQAMRDRVLERIVTEGGKRIDADVAVVGHVQVRPAPDHVVVGGDDDVRPPATQILDDHADQDDRDDERLELGLAAEDGAAALNELQNAHYDMVISDLKMPKMGGLDLLLLRAARGAQLSPSSTMWRPLARRIRWW